MNTNNPPIELSHAAWKNDVDSVKNLVATATQNDKNYALHLAALQGYNPIIEILFDNGATVDAQRTYHPLAGAANNNHIETVQLLLKRGINVNARKGKALIGAAREGNAEMVQLLLENGADMNLQEGRAITTACAKNKIEVLKVFINFGASVEYNKGAPLCAASRNGSYQLAYFLLENGANPKGYNDYNRPIYLAHENAHPALVSLLKEYGADLAQVNYNEINKMTLEGYVKSMKKVKQTISQNHSMQDQLTENIKSIEKILPKPPEMPRQPDSKFNKFLNVVTTTEDPSKKKGPKI